MVLPVLLNGLPDATLKPPVILIGLPSPGEAKVVAAPPLMGAFELILNGV